MMCQRHCCTSAMLVATTMIQGTDASFSTTCGDQQGHPLSPLIFVVYYDMLLRKVQQLHVLVTAFIEDLTAVLPLSRLRVWFLAILDIVRASGMAPTVQKTEMLPIPIPVERVEGS